MAGLMVGLIAGQIAGFIARLMARLKGFSPSEKPFQLIWKWETAKYGPYFIAHK
jgi:hypothetical protein